MSGRITIEGLIRLASRTTALTVDEIKGPCRERRFVRARMAIVYYALRANFNLSQIGRHLGNREHNTIMNLRDKGRVWRGVDPLFDRIMAEMDRGIDAGDASRNILPFVFVERAPAPVVYREDEPDRPAKSQMAAMKRGSDALLRALRAA